MHKKLDLTKYEEYYDKIVDMYCNKLMSDLDIANELNGEVNEIRNFRRRKGIKLTRKQIAEISKRTFVKKYGVDNPWKSKEIKNKIKQTNLEKYGYEVPTQNKLVQDKIKKTCMNKYGSECVLTSKKLSNDLYGVDFFSRRNIPEDLREILYNKENFIRYIESINWDIRNRYEISNRLGVSYSLIEKLCNDYDINNLINRYSSYGEREIYDLISSYGFKCEKNKSIIYPKEIDCFIPELNIGIEFNGNYWHNCNYLNSNYHQEKSLYAKEHGIFIYHIFEYEWNDERKRQIIQSQIKSLLNKNNKIYARNCEIKEVNSSDAMNFLNNNHIQGKRGSKVRIGLYYNNELVSLMTFGKDKFIDKSDNWQLLRFCSKLGITVVGGASKLFKKFIDTYNPNIVISYCDIAKGKGNTYEILGFKLDKITSCNYVWWSPTDGVKTRYQCQKRFIKESNDDNRTEEEIMISKGYRMIQDCGSYKFIYNK